jgi:hypothetical protein
MSGHKLETRGRLTWVNIADLRVSPAAQRRYSKAQAESYAADFDLEALGTIVVNKRDDLWYVIDGQHRVMALRLMGWGDLKVECETYFGLTEREEAELFLQRNTRRNLSPFERFRVALTAERAVESTISQLVLSLGLRIARPKRDGNIGAVTALVGVYNAGGSEALRRALVILRDAYAMRPEALSAEMIRGMGLVCQRYNGSFDDDVAVAKLRQLPGGLAALLAGADLAQRAYGRPRPECVASAIIDAVNRGRRVKLDSWWK